MGFFGFWSYNQQRIGDLVENGLYNGLVVSGVSNEDQAFYMNNSIVKKEPYSTVPKIYSANLSYNNAEDEQYIMSYQEAFNEKVNAPFLSIDDESILNYASEKIADFFDQLSNLDGFNSDDNGFKSIILKPLSCCCEGWACLFEILAALGRP